MIFFISWAYIKNCIAKYFVRLFLRDIFSKFIILGEMRPLGKAITENDINYTGRKAQCLGSLIFCAKILRFFRQHEIDLRS